MMILTWFDLKRLLLSHLRLIQRFSIVGAACTFLFLVTRPLPYLHEATLRTLGGTSAGGKTQELLLQLGGGASVEATYSLLNSKEILHSVIEELGLQVVCPVDSWPLRLLHTIKERCLFEIGLHVYPREQFSFQHVLFSGEEPLRLLLRLLPGGAYELLTRDLRPIGTAPLGESIAAPWGKLSLQTQPPLAKEGVLYPLKLLPQEKTLKRWQRRLKVLPTRLDKAAVNLKLVYPDRQLGAQFLNIWMGACVSFTKQEHAELYEGVIGAVEQEKEKLSSAYEQILFKQRERGGLAPLHRTQLTRCAEIDLELRRLSEQGEVDLRGDAASLLLVDAHKQRSVQQTELHELLLLKSELHNPQFDLTSVGAFLNNPVIDDLIHRASAVTLQMHDTANRSPREQERLSQESAALKSVLEQHLTQMIALKTQKIDLLQTTLASLTHSLEKDLKAEKERLLNPWGGWVDPNGQLPTEWHKDTLFHLKQEQNEGFARGLEQILASLHVSRGSFRGMVRPLDLAHSPQEPCALRVSIGVILAALLSALGLYGGLLLAALYRGFPLSPEMLRAEGAPLLGSFQKNNHEVLRRLIASVDKFRCKQPVTLLLLGGSYDSYAPSLAHLLSLRGHRVLLIQTQQGNPSPYDTYHCPDLDVLHSTAFQIQLASFKERYDYILLYTDLPLTSAAGESLLEIGEFAALSIRDEKRSDLAPYFAWAQGQQRMGLIYHE